MKVPRYSWALMVKMYREVLPFVQDQLKVWSEKAANIPDPELRKQALTSIEEKAFHCEGGAVFALLALDKLKEVICFIVAYQTISDYLDNLCDRSTSLDRDDYRALHQSILDAINPRAVPSNYYCHRNEKEDGGYLRELVTTCQEIISKLPCYKQISPYLMELSGYYCDLQVYKHGHENERIPTLMNWFKRYEQQWPEMSWYEFSACAGSTIGIFCLVSYAARDDSADEWFERVAKSYFPWLQGLHILLDYFIDQEEDREGGDLNFCFYYENNERLLHRLSLFVKEAKKSVFGLPDEQFHRLIIDGLLGVYLTDQKVKAQKDIDPLAKKLIRVAGIRARFFYMNGWFYRKFKK